LSDYTKTTNFTIKDGLSSGDPEKLILGSDIDVELLAIATAIATKYDTAAALLAALLTVDGAASGLDADLLDGQSSAYYLSSSNQNAGTLPDARFPATLPAVSGTALTGVLKTANNLSDVTAATGRTNLGVTATGADTTYAFRSNNLSDVTASTARTNLAVPGKAATETISGAWTFSTRPIFSSAGAFLSYASATQTSGAITVSTSAASGTPAAGDLWIQYTP
jgi:hypothetical protein